MPLVNRLNGKSNFVTTVIIPTELYNRARSRGINVSKVLREALAEKIDAEGHLP